VLIGIAFNRRKDVDAYRVSLESGEDETIEEVDCEDWSAVHAALDKWQKEVHFRGRYIMISAFEKRFTPRI
jgi:hypothetical protein